ncbi:aminoacyl-tRNA hydrolase [Phaeovibrio sulfidiphilus]|uniref:Peptidyl-tRNA hydrolase n=1 Tax=Phaeovibrio sulfidiphilus TaxID=1220600 RepID=A0A8J6YLD5_9PROT|nr:aminoacyl-tRNA hydrolase [Phaeovibrio sulfidiphilus]MBE1236530.1 aminoacyl-tRNA hydrolase [Phaeovibrio sulfidiphilus]
MKLLVGLGNPGSQYEGNRHNVGFMALEALASAYGIGPFRSRFQGDFADGRIGNERVLMLMPGTYMNRSGQSVGEAARFYKIPPSDIIVFHDDLDLAFARVRVKQGGGHGGHNGLRDLDAHIGADYWRVRLGIGHPGDKARVHGHVLSDFSKAERAEIDTLLGGLAKAFPLMLAGDASGMTSRLAVLTKPPRKPGAAKTGTPDPAGPDTARTKDPAGDGPRSRPAPPSAPLGPDAPADTGLAQALMRALLKRGDR